MSDHYLTSAQADGLACVMCSADFVTAEVASRPVGRSETGSQVFACTAYCAETYAIITSLSDEEAAYIARRMQERLDAEAGPATAAVLARAGVEVAGNFGDVTGVSGYLDTTGSARGLGSVYSVGEVAPVRAVAHERLEFTLGTDTSRPAATRRAGAGRATARGAARRPTERDRRPSPGPA